MLTPVKGIITRSDLHYYKMFCSIDVWAKVSKEYG